MFYLKQSKLGMTLVEMVISIVILSILMTSTMGMIISSNNIFISTSAASLDKQVGNAVYDLMESIIRYSTHLEIGDSVNESYGQAFYVAESTTNDDDTGSGVLWYTAKNGDTTQLYDNSFYGYRGGTYNRTIQYSVTPASTDGRHIKLTVSVYRKGEKKYTRSAIVRCVNLALTGGENGNSLTYNASASNTFNQALSFACNEDLINGGSEAWGIESKLADYVNQYNKIQSAYYAVAQPILQSYYELLATNDNTTGGRIYAPDFLRAEQAMNDQIFGNGAMYNGGGESELTSNNVNGEGTRKTTITVSADKKYGTDITSYDISNQYYNLRMYYQKEIWDLLHFRPDNAFPVASSTSDIKIGLNTATSNANNPLYGIVATKEELYLGFLFTYYNANNNEVIEADEYPTFDDGFFDGTSLEDYAEADDNSMVILAYLKDNTNDIYDICTEATKKDGSAVQKSFWQAITGDSATLPDPTNDNNLPISTTSQLLRTTTKKVYYYNGTEEALASYKTALTNSVSGKSADVTYAGGAEVSSKTVKFDNATTSKFTLTNKITKTLSVGTHLFDNDTFRQHEYNDFYYCSNARYTNVGGFYRDWPIGETAGHTTKYRFTYNSYSVTSGSPLAITSGLSVTEVSGNVSDRKHDANGQAKLVRDEGKITTAQLDNIKSGSSTWKGTFATVKSALDAKDITSYATPSTGGSSITLTVKSGQKVPEGWYYYLHSESGSDQFGGTRGAYYFFYLKANTKTSDGKDINLTNKYVLEQNGTVEIFFNNWNCLGVKYQQGVYKNDTTKGSGSKTVTLYMMQKAHNYGDWQLYSTDWISWFNPTNKKGVLNKVISTSMRFVESLFNQTANNTPEITKITKSKPELVLGYTGQYTVSASFDSSIRSYNTAWILYNKKRSTWYYLPKDSSVITAAIQGLKYTSLENYPESIDIDFHNSKYYNTSQDVANSINERKLYTFYTYTLFGTTYKMDATLDANWTSLPANVNGTDTVRISISNFVYTEPMAFTTGCKSYKGSVSKDTDKSTIAVALVSPDYDKNKFQFLITVNGTTVANNSTVNWNKGNNTVSIRIQKKNNNNVWEDYKGYVYSYVVNRPNS